MKGITKSLKKDVKEFLVHVKDEYNYRFECESKDKVDPRDIKIVQTKFSDRTILTLDIKNQKIETLEKRLEDQVTIIDKMVNSKMYEKGNQIVYELDQANRSLKILKDNIHTLEDGIRREIDSQYRSKMNHRETMLFNEK